MEKNFTFRPERESTIHFSRSSSPAELGGPEPQLRPHRPSPIEFRLLTLEAIDRERSAADASSSGSPPQCTISTVPVYNLAQRKNARFCLLRLASGPLARRSAELRRDVGVRSTSGGIDLGLDDTAQRTEIYDVGRRDSGQEEQQRHWQRWQLRTGFQPEEDAEQAYPGRWPQQASLGTAAAAARVGSHSSPVQSG